ncbi:co-chaperone DjlA [Pseudomonas sp. gcc21]|uniref:co-chaperone DjlA n=1 Tax=Pseudomonas sp. gcc21 TaxID=2726989 RepID=UPI001451C06B|nr:co-chaperone DjlA [Pseudomonas sp. gcc21]QJD59400.1 co-chaperone DjlA [Pseudomonas sp. gcc21]
MLWPVTVAGTFLGGLAGGAPGCILGAVLGHALDRHLALQSWGELPQRLSRAAGRQHTFEEVLFLSLGRLAKAEGQVQPAHLQLAREIMSQFRLSDAGRVQAMKAFNRGKDPRIKVERMIGRLCEVEPARAADLMDCCWRMALVNGSLGAASAALLDDWAQRAGLSRPEQQRMHQRHRARSGNGNTRRAPVSTQHLLSEAANVLGVDAAARPEAIKRAYRRLISKHHPDKLTGASQQELATAGERIHAIQQAYERLKRHRGFR